MTELKVNRQYKDRVFRMIFNSREKLLELYNAMNGTDYENVEELEIVTLENAVYLAMKNDLAYVFHDELFLYEQQSSKNKNMPLRCLFYVSDSYSRMVRNENLYGSRQIQIPAPTFVVFYNGDKEQPEQYELKLSDAFAHKTENPQLELKCMVYNINYGKNQELMSRCKILKEYSIFVDYVRFYYKTNNYTDLESSTHQAIDRCIEENILKDFLIKNRAEVVKVTQLDYTFERQLELEREEAISEGRAEGLAEGRAEGHAKGHAEGVQQTLTNIIEQMYTNNFTIEQISIATNQSIETIKEFLLNTH